MFGTASSGSGSEKARAAPSASSPSATTSVPASRATFSKLSVRSTKARRTESERASAAALLDDDAATHRGARGERLAVDVDAHPHGSTQSGTGSATRFSPTRRTTTAQPKETQSPSWEYGPSAGSASATR